MKLGFTKFYDRLWQKNMNSPHLSYFNKKNLSLLFSRHNFYEFKSGNLNSLDANNTLRFNNDNNILLIPSEISSSLYKTLLHVRTPFFRLPWTSHAALPRPTFALLQRVANLDSVFPNYLKQKSSTSGLEQGCTVTPQAIGHRWIPALNIPMSCSNLYCKFSISNKAASLESI